MPRYTRFNFPIYFFLVLIESLLHLFIGSNTLTVRAVLSVRFTTKDVNEHLLMFVSVTSKTHSTFCSKRLFVLQFHGNLMLLYVCIVSLIHTLC